MFRHAEQLHAKVIRLTVYGVPGLHGAPVIVKRQTANKSGQGSSNRRCKMGVCLVVVKPQKLAIVENVVCKKIISHMNCKCNVFSNNFHVQPPTVDFGSMESSTPKVL